MINIYFNSSFFFFCYQDGVVGARRGSGRTPAGYEDIVPQPSGAAGFRVTTSHHLHESRWAHRAIIRVPARDGRDRTT